MARDEAAAATARLIGFVESLPRRPWDGTGEPQDDKRLIGGRYASDGADPVEGGTAASGAKSTSGPS